MVNAVVCGALGRMGMTVGRVITETDGITLAGGIDIRAGTFYGVPVAESARIDEFLKAEKPDVLIDFTVAAAAVENVKAASRNGVAAVVGTTGFSDAQNAAMRTAVEGKIPVVISSNFSIGVNIYWELVRKAASLLRDYDVEVIEAHHRYKKDAPSGTAKTIVRILDEEIGERKKVYGREGMAPRADEIGVHVIRGGDIVGDHTVLFSGNFETINLSHHAIDRAVFAQGAVRAAMWVKGRKPGIYGMGDVLGLGT